jgi:hypothetical protein
MSTNVEGQFVSPNDAKPNVRRSFLSAMWYYHKFFIKESKSFVGVRKKKSGTAFPTFGWVTDYAKKPFNPENKIWSVNGVDYEYIYVYTTKDLLRFPIVYIKFMYWMAKDYLNWKRSQNFA